MRWFWIIAFVLAAVRVPLTAHLPTRFEDLAVDDFLYVRSASHLARGEWLGPYDLYTLAKLPGYSFFLAGVDLSGVPRRIAEDTFFAGAALVMLWALRRLGVGAVLAMVIFVTILIAPASYSEILERPSRLGITMSLTVIVAATWIATLPEARPMKRLGLGILAGLTLAAYDLIREESLWVLPVLGILMAGLCSAERRRGRTKFQAALALCLVIVPAIVIVGATRWALAEKNRRAYGVAIRCEQSEPSFVAAVSAIRDFEPGPYQRFEPLTTQRRERLYAASPIFRSLRSHFESPSYKQPSTVTADGERLFAFDVWLLRDAAAAEGHHASAVQAASFYRRLAREVRTASGVDDVIDFSLPGPHRSLSLEYFRWFGMGIRLTVGHGIPMSLSNPWTTGSARPEQRDLYERVLNEKETPPREPTVRTRLLQWTHRFHADVMPLVALVGGLAILLQIVLMRWVPPRAWLLVQVALLTLVALRIALVAFIETFWWRYTASYLIVVLPLLPATAILGIRGFVLTVHQVCAVRRSRRRVGANRQALESAPLAS